MHLKITDDAEVYPNCKNEKHIGRRVFVLNNNQILDADEIQQLRNAIRPRIQEEVIVA